jgi:hypothetical protein
MFDVQEALQQQLIEETQQLVARGGPAALMTAGKFLLHYAPIESWRFEAAMASSPQSETYYPVAAVLAALAYPDLRTLQEDWNETLGQQGPLPLYLHATADGHYTALIAETVVLQHLIWLTEECDVAMQEN